MMIVYLRQVLGGRRPSVGGWLALSHGDPSKHRQSQHRHLKALSWDLSTNVARFTRMKRSICGAAIIVLFAIAAETTANAAKAPAVPKYKSCAALNAVYPNGVGRTGAVDKTKQEPVTTFTVDDAVYRANTARDRDKDGIACELL